LEQRDAKGRANDSDNTHIQSLAGRDSVKKEKTEDVRSLVGIALGFLEGFHAVGEEPGTFVVKPLFE